MVEKDDSSVSLRLSDGMDEISFLTKGFTATPLDELFKVYKTKENNSWYHLMCSVEDFPMIWTCGGFTFHSFCRCHQVADDSSTSHEHLHAVISTELKIKTWKKQLAQKKIRLYKTLFRPIICGDHLCGILRYLSCREGKKVGRRGADGLVANPHTHYSRHVGNLRLLHAKRKKDCSRIRQEIEEMMTKNYGNLHNFATCTCENSYLGVLKREEANKKRRNFYETEEGLRMREKYRQRKKMKEHLIEEILTLGRQSKAKLFRETTMRLIEILK